MGDLTTNVDHFIDTSVPKSMTKAVSNASESCELTTPVADYDSNQGKCVSIMLCYSTEGVVPFLSFAGG